MCPDVVGFLCSLVLVASAPTASRAEGNDAPATPESPPARVLTFGELLERVRAHNPALLAARASTDVAEGEVRKAWSGWKPNVNAVGSLTFNSVESTFDSAALVEGVAQAIGIALSPEAIAALPKPAVIAPHVQLSGVLGASQTLFNIGVLRAPGAAEAARRAAHARADAFEDDLFFSAATMYATLGGLKALEAASERALGVADQRVQDAQTQLEAGTTTRLALTRAETDRVVADGQRTTVRARRRAMLAGLRALIAAEEEIDVDDRRLSEYVGRAGGAYESRATVIAKMRDLEAAEKAVGLVDMGWLPTLNVEGQLRYTNFEGFSGERFLATAGVNLVIPLYDAGLRYANTAIAEARIAVALRALEQERLQARAFLDEARATLEAARAELTQAEAQLKLAIESVKQAEDLVLHGLATSLELTDADSRRFTADRLVAQKALELDLALLRAYYASGGELLERKPGT